MYGSYQTQWDTLKSQRGFRVAIFLSVCLHALVVYGLVQAIYRRPPEPPISIAHEVEFVQPDAPKPAPRQPEPTPEPPPPPPPEPDPPKPEPPKPDPPKPKEPEKPKVVEKVPEPEKVAEKPPEPEKKPEPEPPPPPPKPTPPRPEPEVKPEPIEIAKKIDEFEPEVFETVPQETGIKADQLPPILNAWGRLVQRKVEKFWVVPAGLQLIQLDSNSNEAHISFWVDRNGRLLGRPTIEKEASDPAVGESGLRAVMLSAPLPPLPEDFQGDRQQVVYVFSVRR